MLFYRTPSRAGAIATANGIRDPKLLPIGKRIAEAMGATDIKISPKFAQSKHIMGGTIMGLDAGDSVVDADCRAYDHDNLFLPGGGAMASTACGNSTITMVSLGLKAADAMVRQLRGAA